MKIGILTFHWADNYGAVLQAYALQTYLQQQGHNVEIIDYRTARDLMDLPFLVRILCKNPLKWRNKLIAFKRHYLFHKFRLNALNLSPRCTHNLDHLGHITSHLDLLITGSDQVWNPSLTPSETSLKAYFLNFGSGSIKRISYAASLGHSSLDSIATWVGQASKLLEPIDAISVRENSGKTLLDHLTKKTVSVVSDPTLLLKAEDYGALFSKDNKKKKNIFSYILHNDDSIAQPIINEVGKLLKIPCVQCNLSSHRAFDHYTILSPENWLKQIDASQFVITNSFHCVVFCLIFHTPFIALPLYGKLSSMNTRVLELLSNVVGLSERFITKPDLDRLKQITDKQVDWDKTDCALAELRKSGVNYLSQECI